MGLLESLATVVLIVSVGWIIAYIMSKLNDNK